MLEKSALETSARPPDLLCEHIDPNSPLVTTHLAGCVLERQIAHLARARPHAESGLQVRYAVFRTRQLHQLLLQPARAGTQDLFRIEGRVRDFGVRHGQSVYAASGRIITPIAFT